MAKNVINPLPEDASNADAGQAVKRKNSASKPLLNLAIMKDERFHLFLNVAILLFAFYSLLAFFSYLFTGFDDQSIFNAIQDESLRETTQEAQNWGGFFGAFLAHIFLFKGLGIGGFFIPPYLAFYSLKRLLKKPIFYMPAMGWVFFFFGLFTSISIGYLVAITNSEELFSLYTGAIGYEVATFLNEIFGLGTPIVLLIILLAFLTIQLKNTAWVPSFFLPKTQGAASNNSKAKEPILDVETDDSASSDSTQADKKLEEDKIPYAGEIVFEVESIDSNKDAENTENQIDKNISSSKEKQVSSTIDFEVNIPVAEEIVVPLPVAEPALELEIAPPVEEKTAEQVLNSAPYDPKLDLSRYLYPEISLLLAHDHKAVITQEELTENKNQITSTLQHFKISISKIKATVGPTVTLYEIVPEAGVKIAKIKSLEDDVALALQALGIRIIAPIPGQGTIGIEVPNKSREVVGFRSVLSTEKFLKSTFDLPIILGKTISNEVLVTDLAKMPHLLIGGSTGQGKSVGLNVILTSLLYKKHPSELKFVLVDPKKVELSIYSRIEKHFLAKLPDATDAIITDTKKVIYTLQSLCAEMDIRYDLLKEANCRNIKEYNDKFKSRVLNPADGHRFLPFIVLVIDELADLMMTAGKEVETPIARLAQLARAIGIHLVIATQRPSVNVITGLIKANFPARIAFKTTSLTDSRTILDAKGANQLVGYGDMLFSHNSNIIRLQCPFIDTPEVEAVCDWIGNQQGYPHAYILPEVDDPEAEEKDLNFDVKDLDKLFAEVARMVVREQKGSTSYIQRKFQLGFNRAGRIMDQLEAYGIVGAQDGSKSRDVYYSDEYQLEQKLREIGL